MPITFEDGWNKLNMARLNDARFVAKLWHSKATMNAKMPAEVIKLDAEINRLDTKKATDGKLNKRDATTLADTTLANNAYKNALARDKVTKAAARFAGYEAADFRTATEVTNNTPLNGPGLDARLEQIHNDRLRLTDRQMLSKYTGIDIRIAIRNAASKFTANPKVAGFFARALATSGDAVVVTQGVHQSDDPHFDVRLPGDAQQIHVEVDVDPGASVRVKIKSVSYMNGPRKADGVTQVKADGT